MKNQKLIEYWSDCVIQFLSQHERTYNAYKKFWIKQGWESFDSRSNVTKTTYISMFFEVHGFDMTISGEGYPVRFVVRMNDKQIGRAYKVERNAALFAAKYAITEIEKQLS